MKRTTFSALKSGGAENDGKAASLSGGFNTYDDAATCANAIKKISSSIPPIACKPVGGQVEDSEKATDEEI